MKMRGFSFFFYKACGISLSLGLLLHGLVSCGHGGVIQMARQHGHDWRNVLDNKVKQDLKLYCVSCICLNLTESMRAFLTLVIPL